MSKERACEFAGIWKVFADDFASFPLHSLTLTEIRKTQLVSVSDAMMRSRNHGKQDSQNVLSFLETRVFLQGSSTL